MKIAEVIGKRKGTLSFEIFPPKGDFDMQGVRDLLAALSPLSPAYISVTYSAGGSKNNRLTEEIASMTQKENHIPSACHITVINSTKEEVRAAIDSFHRRGIENVLALRGDKVEGAAGAIAGAAAEKAAEATDAIESEAKALGESVSEAVTGKVGAAVEAAHSTVLEGPTAETLSEVFETKQPEAPAPEHPHEA